MEKGKLQRSAKDASKRSRQVSAEGSVAAGGGGGKHLVRGGGDSLSGLSGWEEGLGGGGAPTLPPSPQAPVLYAMLDHSRSTKAASEKKAKGAPGESRKDKK